MCVSAALYASEAKGAAAGGQTAAGGETDGTEETGGETERAGAATETHPAGQPADPEPAEGGLCQYLFHLAPRRAQLGV